MTSLDDRLELLQHPSSPFQPRLGSGPISTALALGPLAGLEGEWTGNGFNTIWRPFSGDSDHFLKLNLTRENLTFTAIAGPVPNRGLLQQDINLYGLHYLQQISDSGAPRPDPRPGEPGEAMHIEPGFWMNVPATSDPDNGPTVVRLSSIPHGNALLAQGPTPPSSGEPGPPDIPDVSIKPLDGGVPLDFPEEQIAFDTPSVLTSNGPFPAGITQPRVDNPNLILQEAIADQEILSTITLKVSSEGTGSGVENIPFLGTFVPPDELENANAFVQSVEATFWLETVRLPIFKLPLPKEGPPEIEVGPVTPPRNPLHVDLIEPFWETATFTQLQYSQTVMLSFNGLLWPHVSVATLTLSNG